MIYSRFIKRLLDFIISLAAVLLLSPILVILIIIGTIAMKGNPFFLQKRPGKDEKIFGLVKFRTMSNARDADGKLLPDAERLNGYGKFLRSTSLDELPELLNILIGDMSFVGPRPLLIKYLPLYNEAQKRRHSVRPGLTGYAQINGRNASTWTKRFENDIHYVDNVSFSLDMKILFSTVAVVFRREGITEENNATMSEFTGNN